MDENERRTIIENALKSEYSEIWNWEPTPIETPYGPDNMADIRSFAARVANMRSISISALSRLPDDEIIRMRDFRKTAHSLASWPWAEHLPSDPNRYLKQLPKLLMYGFGHPSFKPDFDYWALMPDLSVEEATFLSVGADPSFMTKDTFEQARKEKPEHLWASLRFLVARYELLFRVYPTGPSGKMTMATANLYRWFDETGLDIHPAFKAALEKRFAKPDPTPTIKETTNAEKASLLKLIAAMAIEQYSYDPGALRNEAVQNISDDLDGLGIGLDPKTIRKWLKEACELIDPENMPK